MDSDYDGAWKDLLHTRLREVLACYFPAVAAAVDWSEPARFLDQELRELRIAEDAVGNRVDVLVEVRTLEGETQVIYLHMEVQSFQEEEFPARLHACFQGLSRATGCDVVTLAVLADLRADWKPDTYRYSRLGCEVTFRYPVCKLLEILPRLEDDISLPALAAKAQIAALKTSRNPDLRLAARLRLARSLFDQGNSREEVRDALRLVSWMMQLPREQTLQYRQKIVELYQMNGTAYMTDLEQLIAEEVTERVAEKAMSQGRLLALKEDVIEVLSVRFDRVPEGLKEAVCEIADEPKLRHLHKAALRAGSVEDFANAL
jgi:hypothetical protein